MFRMEIQIVVIGMILTFAGYTEGIQCYQCAASREGSPCQSDVERLLDQRENGGSFAKNCSVEKNQHYCMIETSQNRGHVSTFLRDCSDGFTTSFEEIDRLQGITATNQTTCATFGLSGTIVCMTLCGTDFCNGPQAASGHAQSTTGLMLLCAIISHLVLLVPISDY